MTDTVIDMNVVQELLDLCDDDAELLVDLIRMFLEDAPAKVEAIVVGIAENDLEAVHLAAHSLKGSAGNLGAVAVQQIAEDLQNAGRNRDREAIERLAEPLQTQYRIAEDQLRQLLDRHAG